MHGQPRRVSALTPQSRPAKRRGSARPALSGTPLVAALPVGPGDARVDFELTVTTFNGPKLGGKPTILLHAYSAQEDFTTVLVGVLSRARGQFATKLVVSAPVPRRRGRDRLVQRRDQEGRLHPGPLPEERQDDALQGCVQHRRREADRQRCVEVQLHTGQPVGGAAPISLRRRPALALPNFSLRT